MGTVGRRRCKPLSNVMALVEPAESVFANLPVIWNQEPIDWALPDFYLSGNMLPKLEKVVLLL
jgi:hypothetical protein